MSTAAPGTVVYVDDEVLLCRAFAAIVRRHCPNVVAFSDPAAAVAYLREHEVSLIFCDLRMPAMSGLDLLGYISTAPHPVPPFYVVTGDLEVAQALATNPLVRRTLAKPFDVDEVLAIIAEHLPPS